MASPYYLSQTIQMSELSLGALEASSHFGATSNPAPWKAPIQPSELYSPPVFTHMPSTDYAAYTYRLQASKSVSSPSETHETQTWLSGEQETRKLRRREQNRESQRAYRRRQENRVKYLEIKASELEATTRSLRAENAQLKQALHEAESANEALMVVYSIPSSPLTLASGSSSAGSTFAAGDSPATCW